MSVYSYVLNEADRGLLLEAVGESCDNAPDRAKEDDFNRLFERIQTGGEIYDDFTRHAVINPMTVGRVGNELLRVMRRLAESEEQGRAQDVTWLTHELCAMVRGLMLAGWEVLIKPQPSGMFRCVEIEGHVFKV